MEIEERASLSSFSSFSNRDLKTLALTGNNVLISNKPLKNLRSLKQSHSMPEVPTIDEMIGTKKESMWGISNYIVPKFGTNLDIKRKISMAQKCGSGMIDLVTKTNSYIPSPSTYNIDKKWSTTVLGCMKGGERRTFISQIFRTQELKPKPGPGQHSPNSKHVKKRNILGIANKDERLPFTSNAEFLSSESPSAIYLDPLKRKLPKPFKYELKKKNHPWKVDKVEGPDPQSYPLQEEALKKTKQSSPKWGLGKSPRKFFTDDAQKNKANCPGAGNYELIDYNKIHRNLSSKRH